MDRPISLSIIIPVFNCLELTQLCLKSLETSLKGVIDYEVIIVDDGSTDGTREFLQTLTEPPYRILLNKDKVNFAINNNRSATIARGELLCLLNNDTELPDGWLQPMLAGLETYPDAGFIGNVQKIHATERYDHFGVVFPSWLTPIHYGQHLKQRPALHGAYSRWAAVTAACVLIKKDVFLSVGGFNESYVNGCEDMDLCIRLHQKGHWHYVAHESEILHHKGSSPSRKKHNNTNLEKFKATHSDYLKQEIVPRDSRLAARSYLRGCIAYPSKTNFTKLLQSIKTLGKPQTARTLQQPECGE
jgi:GT2 family glycosyltransferase